MKKLAAFLVLAASLAPFAASPALADHGRGPERGHQPGFHDRGHRDNGRWHDGWHNGRYGRWWVVGNMWNYYPSYPTYPGYYASYPAYPAYYPAPVYRSYVAPAPTVGISFSGRF